MFNLHPIVLEEKDYIIDRVGDGPKVVRGVSYISIESSSRVPEWDSKVIFYNNIFKEVGFAFITDLLGIKELDSGER